ncbi:MAG: IS1096 element passenger TnpR family protein [Candidatus Bathycorpusculaceae bacterium]
MEKTGKERARIFHIAVQGRYSPEYWMHLEVVADAKLKALDSFLRDVWLECCGHLSAFTIEGVSYNSSLDRESLFYSSFRDKSMNCKISSVLSVGMRFIHEYDFGTTTELALRVVSERMGEPVNKPVYIMGRNDPPELACVVCGKAATQVCTQCIWNGEGWLCEKCASDHKCGEEMLLPVVNSPRVGMCGYTGDGE